MNMKEKHFSYPGWKVLEETRRKILDPASHPSLGENLNGPSVIRVPDWVRNPLGQYYMYFAHHRGTFIRLAYADHPEGPWQVHAPGCLEVEKVPELWNHIASPDILVDDDRREIRMYVHGAGGLTWWQESTLTLSTDGLNFQPQPGVVGPYYLRVFRWQGRWLGIARDHGSEVSLLLESPDGIQPFRRLGNSFHRGRHFGLLPDGDILWVFYSRLYDVPERILVSRVRMEGEPKEWEFEDGSDLLRPALDWEGVNFRLAPSRIGDQTGVRQLRDPFVFREDGIHYLYYSGGGESCLGMVRIQPT